MAVRLTAYLPEGAAADFLLRPPATVRVGRAADCELVIDHASISRQHAELRHGDSGWQLQDLDSKNGTFVEGARIRDQPLERSVWLRFGDVPCEFQLLDSDAANRTEQRLLARREASRAHTLRAERQSGLRDLLQATVDAVHDLAGADRTYLLTPAGNAFEVRAWRDPGVSGGIRPEFPGSRGAVDKAAQSRRAVVVNDLGGDPSLGGRASVVAGGLRSLVCLPLLFGAELLGLVYADSRTPGAVVTALDLELLDAFGERASLWIAARRNEEALAQDGDR